MEVARCGVYDCNTCSHLVKGRCPGCETGNLIVKSENREACHVYECAEAKGLTSCKACTSADCPLPHDIGMICPVHAQFKKTRCHSRKLTDYYTSRLQDGPSVPGNRKVSDRTITRLRWYLVALDGFIEQGITHVSSQDMGRKVGVKPGLIRRDLSHFGEFGRPSIGYDAVFLRDSLQSIMHLDNSKTVVWVGPRRLEEDASLLERFAEQNCHVAAVFSTEGQWIGKRVAGIRVDSVNSLCEKVRALDAQGAVIDVCADEVQYVVDLLVSAGVTAMLNLSSAVVVAPSGVVVRNIDVAAELSALSYYCGEKSRQEVMG